MDCFDVEVNAEEAETTFELNNTHIDNDNEKLFDIYERYLNANRDNDNDNNQCEYDSQTDISFDDDFTHIIKARIANHSKKRTRQYSCLADIEKSVKEFDFRKSLNNTKNFDNIGINNESNDDKLEVNIEELTNEQLVVMVNELERDLNEKMSCYPQIIANNLKNVYRKHIEVIKQISNCDVGYTKQKSPQKCVQFDRLLARELNEIEVNSNLIEKLIEDLKMCEKLCQKQNNEKIKVSD